MLASDYSTTINMASKYADFEFRQKIIRKLMSDFESQPLNVLDLSRILLDVAKLMGLIEPEKKFGNKWHFTDWASTELLTNPTPNSLEKEIEQKIEVFKKECLFNNFNSFAQFWLEKTKNLTDPGEFTNEFYRFIPYVLLGIDDEPVIKKLGNQQTGQSSLNSIKHSLARQKVINDRMEKIFLKNSPPDLPETTKDSMLSFAQRLDDEGILLTTEKI